MATAADGRGETLDMIFRYLHMPSTNAARQLNQLLRDRRRGGVPGLPSFSFDAANIPTALASGLFMGIICAFLGAIASVAKRAKNKATHLTANGMEASGNVDSVSCTLSEAAVAVPGVLVSHPLSNTRTCLPLHDDINDPVVIRALSHLALLTPQHRFRNLLFLCQLPFRDERGQVGHRRAPADGNRQGSKHGLESTEGHRRFPVPVSRGARELRRAGDLRPHGPSRMRD